MAIMKRFHFASICKNIAYEDTATYRVLANRISRLLIVSNDALLWELPENSDAQQMCTQVLHKIMYHHHVFLCHLKSRI